MLRTKNTTYRDAKKQDALPPQLGTAGARVQRRGRLRKEKSPKARGQRRGRIRKEKSPKARGQRRGRLRKEKSPKKSAALSGAATAGCGAAWRSYGWLSRSSSAAAVAAVM